METKLITPKIIMIKAANQTELARMFMRPQEYYESPNEEIRGKIFTLGYLHSLYAMNSSLTNSHGVSGYINCQYFDNGPVGFNIPSTALDPFIKGLFDPLTREEQSLVDAFRYRTDSFYVLGCIDSLEPDLDTTKHETAHGLFYTCQKYREEVLAEMKKKDLTKLFELLKKKGYPTDKYILHDEAHAFFGVDFEWTVEAEQKRAKEIGLVLEDYRAMSIELIRLYDLYLAEEKKEEVDTPEVIL